MSGVTFTYACKYAMYTGDVAIGANLQCVSLIKLLGNNYKTNKNSLTEH